MQNIKMEAKKMGEMYTEKEWMTQMVYYLLHLCTTPQRTQTMQNRESQILAKPRRSVIETLYVRCSEGRGK